MALVRGPNLNSWEMQNFVPLMSVYDLVGFTSRRHNFDIEGIPFEVRRLPSWGQVATPRIIRRAMYRVWGDYHDLQGLGKALDGFDIVHAVEPTYYCTFQCAEAKLTHGYKLVVTVWENIPYLFNYPATQRAKRFVFQQTDLFLAVTERAKEVLILEGVSPEKICVQYPGIDVEHFRPREKDQDLLNRFQCTKDNVVLLFVAHLYMQKGIYDLLCAVRKLQNAGLSNVKLLIVGTGPEKERVLSFIERLGLGDTVLLIGSHPYSHMPSIHNLADILVLPSQPSTQWQEQFGYVLVESMACGKPVISTTSGSIPEVVRDAGILVPSNDFISLANAIQTLVQSAKLRQRLGAKGRVRVEQLFDAKKVALQIKSRYETLLNG